VSAFLEGGVENAMKSLAGQATGANIRENKIGEDEIDELEGQVVYHV
jgi:hypothetical protein